MVTWVWPSRPGYNSVTRPNSQCHLGVLDWISRTTSSTFRSWFSDVHFGRLFKAGTHSLNHLLYTYKIMSWTFGHRGFSSVETCCHCDGLVNICISSIRFTANSRKSLPRPWIHHRTSVLSETSCSALVLPGPSTRTVLRWPNTVFARDFADVIQRTQKDCKNKNVVNRAIILFIQNPHFLRYFSLLLNAVYWCLHSLIIKIC